MKLQFDHPYTYAGENRYPLDVAYLSFAPCASAPLGELLVWARQLGGGAEVSVAVIRPYGGHSYTCAVQVAGGLMNASAAEGYAVFPSQDEALVRYDLQHFDYSEESALVGRYRNGLIMFLHEGHHSVDVLGSLEEVTRCLVTAVGLLSGARWEECGSDASRRSRSEGS